MRQQQLRHPVDTILERAVRAAAKLNMEAWEHMTRLVRSRPDLLNGRWMAEASRLLRRYVPHLERLFRDAALAGYFKGATNIARTINSPFVSGDFGPGTIDPSLLVGPSRWGLPPGPPRLPPGALFPEQPDDPPPIVRLPLIERAAENLAGKRLMTRSDFDMLDQDARRSAFTVAHLTTDAALGAVREALVESIETGGSMAKFRRDLKQSFGRSPLAEPHMETVFRTNLASAYSAGQQAILDHPLVTSEFPYVLWVAVHDPRVRDEHLAMEKLGLDGTGVYRRDDPVILRHWPPASYNCVLPGTKVEGSFCAAVRSHYHGQAVEIVTRRGSVIRVTEKHPVLTENGWVCAGTLQKGDKLFRHERHREIVRDSRSFVELNGRATQVNNGPTVIEQVFDTLAASGFSEHRRAKTGDFHGEGEAIHGQVDVVWSDWRLLTNREASLAKHGRDVVFKETFGASMRGLQLASSLPSRQERPFHTFSFGSTSQMDAGILQPLRQCPSANAVLIGNSLNRTASNIGVTHSRQVGDCQPIACSSLSQWDAFTVSPQSNTMTAKHATKACLADPNLGAQSHNGFASQVSLNDVVEIRNAQSMRTDYCFANPPHFNPSQLEMPLENGAACSKFLRQRIRSLPSLVTSDEVVKIRKFQWSGQVYDLQSTTGLIVADSVLIANCRCHVIHMSIEDAAAQGCREAQRWLRTGNPPAVPSWVKPLPFELSPPGWVGGGRRSGIGVTV